MVPNSKETIKKVIEFDDPGRIGLVFNPPNRHDILWVQSARLSNPQFESASSWGYYPEVLKCVPQFKGEVLLDVFGNIYGRLGERTKGECIKGAIQDGWDYMDDYTFPDYDEAYEAELQSVLRDASDKFLLGALPIGIFSTIMDLRRIDNILADLALEEDNVLRLLEKIESLADVLVTRSAQTGFDGLIIYDDWGTQNALLISPAMWRRIFKPIYRRISEKIHAYGMKFFLHSCGNVYDIIEDFIEIGVDVLQFDQPELIGVERLAEDFGGRVTFWCPVDIQRDMLTGDRVHIERAAAKMLDNLGRYSGGFIAKDYPAWEDIGVKEEWAQWARDVFTGRRKVCRAYERID